MKRPRENVSRAQTASFSSFYEEHSDAILRYCLVRIDDPAEAEDTAATILARAFAGWPPEKLNAARSWVFSIAHNVVANHYRTSSNRPAQEPIDDASSIADHRPSPLDFTVRREERTLLLNAIAELSADQRTVIEFRLAGLTGPEIVAATGRSHAAVKMLQYRAINHLRQLLTLSEENPAVMKGNHAKEYDRAT